MAQRLKHLPAMRETRVRSLDQSKLMQSLKRINQPFIPVFNTIKPTGPPCTLNESLTYAGLPFNKLKILEVFDLQKKPYS